MKFTSKYLITDIEHPRDPSLHRIRAVADFGGVKSGDLGGFVKSYDNLDISNSAWVSYDSVCKDRARVLGNALLMGNSVVQGECYVYENAVVDSSVLKGHARVFGFANVRSCVLLQNAWVHGASVCIDSIITDDVSVYGQAVVVKSKLRGLKWISVNRAT